MSIENKTFFKNAVENIFCRWTALKLAVEHGMAKNGLQTAIEFVDYLTDSCVAANFRVNFDDLSDLLEDILDQEFDTICEDDSIKQISNILLKFMEMIRNGQQENINVEISQMPPCEMWIRPGSKINYVQQEDSSSEDESITPSTSGCTMEVVEEEMCEKPEPGWTVVRKGKKRS